MENQHLPGSFGDSDPSPITLNGGGYSGNNTPSSPYKSDTFSHHTAANADPSNILEDMRYDLDKHYQHVNSEVDRLTTYKVVFDERRQVYTTYDQVQTQIDSKYDSTRKQIDAHSDALASERQQLDKVVSAKTQDHDKLKKQLNESKRKTDDVIAKNNDAREAIDKKFSEDTYAKDSLIQELLDKVNKAKRDLQKERKDVRRLENEFDNIIDTPNHVQDLIEDVARAKDPKYDPNELKRAEEDNYVLKEKLNKLEQNKDMMSKTISEVDDEIYKLSKQKNTLSDHENFNHQLKQERDDVKNMVEVSARKQKELYDENVEKLRQIKDIEIEILRKDQDIMKYVTQSTIRDLQITLTSDLKDRLNELENGINHVDRSTTKIDRDINSIKPKVENKRFLEPLKTLQGKVKDLGSRNGNNGETKDQLRTDIVQLDEDLDNINPDTISTSQIDEFKNTLNKIEGTMTKSEGTKDQHIDELNSLQVDFEKVKTDICDDLERKIKEVQKKDELLVTETDKNSKSADGIITDLDSKIEPDNPYMRKFSRKLNDAKSKLNQIDYDGDKNKGDQTEQSQRPIMGDDYFAFLYKLSNDQTELDDEISENKKRSDDLMDMLNKLQGEFDEANCQTKDELISECRKIITLRLDELSELEQKMKQLETGVDKNSKQAGDAMRVLDKSHPDYEEVSRVDQGLKGLTKDTKGLRVDKDDVSDELHRIMNTLNRPDLRKLSMADIIKLQEDTNSVSNKHSKTSDGIDEGLGNLKDLELSLQRILESIKNSLKEDADTLSTDLESKLAVLQKFLKPTSATSNSIQRPQKLRTYVDKTPIDKSDEEYAQYQTYSKLVDDNLLRCTHATNDLDILDKQVTPTLRSYSSYSSRGKDTITQIEFLQESNSKLSSNSKPSSDLIEVTEGIQAQLDAKKEQEILDFLNNLRAHKLKYAQDRYKQANLDLSELEKRLKETSSENDGFISVLNKANNNPKNKERVNLIATLLQESDGSKRDLKKIKADKDKTRQLFDTMSQKLSVQDPTKINIKDLYDIIADLEQCQTVIDHKVEDLGIIDAEIEERKNRWREFLANTEAKDKLIKELLSLIPLTREKYERLIKNHSFGSKSIDGFILVNQKIVENEDYQTNETPCLDREQLKLQMGDYENKIIEYGPQVDRLETFDANKLKNAPADEIHTLISDATNLLKNLDSDNQSLDKTVVYLKDERKDFKDGDIYANHTRVEKQIGESDLRLQALIDEFESLKETLQNTDNQKLTESFGEIETNISKSTNLLQMVIREFGVVSKEVLQDSMETAKLTNVAGIIEQLGKICQDLTELDRLLTSSENIFKELQSELIELYYAKKLNDLKSQISILLDRLKRLNDLIDKLIELSRALEGYTSDNEEDEFVNDLETELQQVKRQHTSAQEQLLQVAADVEKLEELLKNSPPETDEKQAELIERAVSDVSGMVEGIERLVDSKIQRFADMDPYKKFMRRQKEYKKLSNILDDRDNIITEIKREAGGDLKNPDASDELKKVCSEILDELDPIEEELESLKQRMSVLGTDVEANLEKSAKTEMTIEEIFELLYSNVEIKKKLKVLLSNIDEFSKALSDVRKRYMMKKAESPPKKNYKAAKGDEVDRMLGDWINNHGCEIEIKRLGNGFYMFGEKKIFAKIVNGKLIIRVGGGFMNIDEFMKHYGMIELARQQRIYEMEYESLNYDELMSAEDEMSQPENRSSVMGSAQAKKNLRGSFKGSFRGSPGKASPKAGRHGSPRAAVGKPRPGSPRYGQNRPGSPGNKSFKGTMPSASKIEESLRKMEEDAKNGKLKEGYNNMTYKK